MASRVYLHCCPEVQELKENALCAPKRCQHTQRPLECLANPQLNPNLAPGCFHFCEFLNKTSKGNSSNKMTRWKPRWVDGCKHWAPLLLCGKWTHCISLGKLSQVCLAITWTNRVCALSFHVEVILRVQHTQGTKHSVSEKCRRTHKYTSVLLHICVSRGRLIKHSLLCLNSLLTTWRLYMLSSHPV
jgi:hypothetical protein